MTMTLEELRADLATWQPRRTHDLSTIDAAIRERNELTMRGITWMEEAQTLRARAEKAEAELAALRKRFAEPPTDVATLNRACDAYQESAEAHGWDAEIVADVLRCDDMRAAIAAAWPVCTAGGE